MGGYERDMQELTLEQAVARNKIIAKYEDDCKKLREDPSLLDRLAAENAELRKWKADLEAKIAAASKIGMEFGEMEFDAWFPGSRPKTRKELTAELAAANATLDQERAAYAVLLESHEIILDALTESDAALDALREAVPEYDDEWQDWEPGDLMRLASAVYAILNPQPAAMAEEKTNE